MNMARSWRAQIPRELFPVTIPALTSAQQILHLSAFGSSSSTFPYLGINERVWLNEFPQYNPHDAGFHIFAER